MKIAFVCKLCNYEFSDECWEDHDADPHFCPQCGGGGHLKQTMHIEKPDFTIWSRLGDALLMGFGFAVGNALYNLIKGLFSA